MSEIDEIIKDFEFLDTWEDRYQLIIDMGKNLPVMEEKLKIESNKLRGCQSTVYFVSKDNPDNTIYFLANSDAFIVQGLIALILKVFNNKTPTEIMNTKLSFLKKIGLDKHLSPTRKNGLSSLIERIKTDAKIKLEKNGK